MREIKFRAWNKEICRMFSPEEMGKDELTINPDGRGFVNVSGTNTKLSQYYLHMIPLQCTGLKDQDETDIYEGDLIRTICGIKHVVYSEDTGCFDAITRIGARSLYGYLADGDVEIVGNIYENKELCEVE